MNAEKSSDESRHLGPQHMLSVYTNGEMVNKSILNLNTFSCCMITNESW